MNRKGSVKKSLELLKNIRDKLELVKREYEDTLDKMKSFGDTYDKYDNNATCISDAIDLIDDAISQLEEVE